jgi:hypothetical protein
MNKQFVSILGLISAGLLGQVSAYADSFTCTANDNDATHATTLVTISSDGNQTTASVVVRGGIAFFVTAPHTFDVQVDSYGEIARYTNADQNFAMTVDFQPIDGVVTGSLDMASPSHFNASLVCNLAK